MTDSSNTRAFPTRDLRGMYTWLRERKANGKTTTDVEQGLDAIKRLLRVQLEKARQGVLGAENDPQVSDRQLDYPFTRGISVINDGIAYGEIIEERRIAAAPQESDDGTRTALQDLKVRRTKTGRIEFWPVTGRRTP